MKDQCKLLRSCINNDIPACVLQGDDSCMAEILEAALSIYKRHGCTIEFLYDFRLLINEVKAYQAENPNAIKLPKLLSSEAELIREEINKNKEKEWKKIQQMRDETISNWKKNAEQAVYIEYTKEKMCNGKFGIIEIGSGNEKTREYVLLIKSFYPACYNFEFACFIYFPSWKMAMFDLNTGIRHESCKVIRIEDVSDQIAEKRYLTFEEKKQLILF